MVEPRSLPTDKDGAPLSGLLVSPRWSAGSFVGYAVLYGCDGDPSKSENWYGPIDRQAISATAWGVSTKTVGSEGYYCAPSLQFDTQDFPRVAVLWTLASSDATFKASSGLFLDVHVQNSRG